jgi:polar amino acid transport system substrate-binding protein
VIDAFLSQQLEVAAGVRQQHEADAARLSCFVEDMKASGFVAQALARHGVAGASVVPLAQGNS